MKKLGFIVMPLMAISLLASCGGGDKPAPEPEEEFTVTFDANGGTLSGESSIKVNDGTLFKDIANKPTASKTPVDAYTFNGWGLSEHTTDKIKDDFKITDNLTVYAIYTPNAYANVIFSEESKNCTLSYNGNVLTKGVPCKIPAGADVALKIESNQDYFPILDGDVEIQEAQTYSLNLIEQEIIIKVAKDNTCVIKAEPENTPRENLEAYTWPEINILSKAGLADTCFEVGETKEIKVNNKNHLVRIIGINEDKDKDGNDIGITFEFATLISDSDGYSIATQRNDTDDDSTANHNYLDSSVRMALVGEKQEKGHILWAQYSDQQITTWSAEEDYKKSVLEMLPEELTKVLVAPQKTVQCYENGEWKDKPIINSKGEYDKLFLLSPEEMGNNATREGAYTYYQEKDDAKLKSLRIKKQVNGESVLTNYSTIPSGSAGQEYQGDVTSYAGYNYSSDNTGGGFSWLRSPSTNVSNLAWYVSVDGSPYNSYVYNNAFAVAPAFCI